MKKIFLILIIAAGTFISCEKTETALFDANQFDPGYTFINIEATESLVGDQSVQYLVVTTTRLSDQPQTFQIVLNEDLTTAEPESFNLPSEIVIPANSYEGIVDIEFTINGLPSVPRTIVFDYIVPEGTTVLSTDDLQATIDFEAVTLCDNGDVTVDVTTDQYPGETSWSIEDEDGNVVAASPAFGSAGTDFSDTVSGLASGCYTFTIFDSYGDGICCAYGNGSYSISCSNGTVIKSGGDFGSEDSVFFCIN